MGAPNNSALETPLHALLEAVQHARVMRDVTSAVALLQKAVEGLQDGLAASNVDPQMRVRCRDCHLLVLKALQDQRAFGPQWTNKQITRWVRGCLYVDAFVSVLYLNDCDTGVFLP